MSNEEDNPIKYAVYNVKTNKFWGQGSTYGSVGAAKNSWNAHTRYRDVYPLTEAAFWKRAKWSEDAQEQGFVVVKVKLVVVDET